jgi:hypothetical protein
MAIADRAEPEIVSYTLRFPSELDADQVTAWLHSLSGLLPGPVGRLWGAPSIVFELCASAEHGFQYRIAVPRRRAEYVVGQLRVQLPGVRVTPEKKVGVSATASSWTQVVELGMRKLDRGLRVDAAPLAGSVLASLQGFALHRGEVALMQWVLRPAVPEAPPAQQAARPVRVGLLSVSPHVPVRDAVADQRAKLSAVNFLAVLRVGVKAGSEARAEQLLGYVRAALRSTSTTANGLYVRTALQSRLRNALDAARVPLMFPIQLTAAELTGLLAWPIGSPHVAGLPQARSRHLPPSGTIPRTGLVVCCSNFPGAERPLALSPVDTCKHIHTVGPIGVGKTVLMGNLVAQAMRAGNAVIVMESKGDLFKAALDAVPKSRVDDEVMARLR